MTMAFSTKTSGSPDSKGSRINTPTAMAIASRRRCRTEPTTTPPYFLNRDTADLSCMTLMNASFRLCARTGKRGAEGVIRGAVAGDTPPPKSDAWRRETEGEKGATPPGEKSAICELVSAYAERSATATGVTAGETSSELQAHFHLGPVGRGV